MTQLLNQNKIVSISYLAIHRLEQRFSLLSLFIITSCQYVNNSFFISTYINEYIYEYTKTFTL